MSGDDAKLLALAEGTPMERLASWWGCSVSRLASRLARLRAEQAALAVVELASGQGAAAVAPAAPISRVVPSAGCPVLPPATARERETAAERGASAANPLRPRPTPAARAIGDPRAVEVLRPLTPARLRYAGWFHRSGWSVGEIAHLFDLDAEALAAELL